MAFSNLIPDPDVLSALDAAEAGATMLEYIDSLGKHDHRFMESTSTRPAPFGMTPLATTFPDPEHSIEEPRFTTIGVSLSGRILVGPYGSRQGDPSNQREAGDSSRAQVP